MNNSSLISELKLLASHLSPSSFEDDVQEYFLSTCNKHCDAKWKDVLGNAYIRLKGKSNFKIMIAAHADEIGFIITNVLEQGYLSFARIGGVNASFLQGREVVIHHENSFVSGVIGKRRDINNEDSNVSFENLWIDIGCFSKREALKKVSIGDVVTFKPNFTKISNGIICSKSMDNRSGLLIMEDLGNFFYNKDIIPEIYLVATVQEEIGCRGIMTAVYNVNPDVCIILDVTHATDYPGNNSNISGDIHLSQGAVISFGADVNMQLQNVFKKICIERKIKFQIEVNGKSSYTDAGNAQLSRQGIVCGLLSIPCRYMHTPVEMISLSDINSCSNILKEFITNFQKWENALPLKKGEQIC